MFVVANKNPSLIILFLKSGKPKISIEIDSSGEFSTQIQYYFRKLSNQSEVIDASGNYFRGIQPKFSGVDWRFYWSLGILGLLILPFHMVFGVLIVRLKLMSNVEPSFISLQEVKEKLTALVKSDPGGFSHAPPDEILRKIEKARSISSLIRNIFKE